MTITTIDQTDDVFPWGAGPPTAVPCPDWCHLRTGHPYECESEEGFEQRYHHVQFGDFDDIDVFVSAQATYKPDGEHVDPLRIHITLGGSSEPVQSAEHARALAGYLIAAAGWMEAQS